VTQDRKIDLKDLLSYKRTREISDTRAIISYLAAIELKNSGTKIASRLRLSEKSVSRCIERGKKLLLCREMPFSFIFHWYYKDENLLDYVQ
jgi:chromosomal replication initiation ATPase DnaA